MRPHYALYRSQPRVRTAAGLRPQRGCRRESWRARHAQRHRPDRRGNIRCADGRGGKLFTTNLMRTPVMSGNWKMYKTPAETTAFFEKFRPLVEKSSHCEIVICPPFTNLAAAVDAVKGSNIRVGAQNIGWAKEGAFTREISGPMIVAVGASHTIIGHSERRQYFCETDETVLKRTQAAREFGLTPIVCVGELLTDRENGNTEAGLAAQFP